MKILEETVLLIRDKLGADYQGIFLDKLTTFHTRLEIKHRFSDVIVRDTCMLLAIA